jgi:hypothetical protein
MGVTKTRPHKPSAQPQPAHQVLVHKLRRLVPAVPGLLVEGVGKVAPLLLGHLWRFDRFRLVASRLVDFGCLRRRKGEQPLQRTHPRKQQTLKSPPAPAPAVARAGWRSSRPARRCPARG